MIDESATREQANAQIIVDVQGQISILRKTVKLLNSHGVFLLLRHPD